MIFIAFSICVLSAHFHALRPHLHCCEYSCKSLKRLRNQHKRCKLKNWKCGIKNIEIMKTLSCIKYARMNCYFQDILTAFCRENGRLNPVGPVLKIFIISFFFVCLIRPRLLFRRFRNFLPIRRIALKS